MYTFRLSEAEVQLLKKLLVTKAKEVYAWREATKSQSRLSEYDELKALLVKFSRAKREEKCQRKRTVC